MLDKGKINKTTLITVLIPLAFLLLVALYGIFVPSYYNYRIENNYKYHGHNLVNIELFIKAKYPVDISFEKYPLINIVTWVPTKSGKQYVDLREVSLNDKRFLETIRSIGWNQDDILKLRSMLSSANCFSVFYYAPEIPSSNQDTTRGIEIGFIHNSLLGYWTYLVFPNPISKSQMELKPLDRERIKYLGEQVGWTKMQ